MKLSSSILFAGLLLAVQPTWADNGIQKVAVQFKKGASSTQLRGSIKGDQTIDYQLSAGAGQDITVHFKPSNLSAYFNVLPPGSSDEAIFIGSSDGNDFKATLKSSGTYTLRVYLMRNAARRHETANYTLEVAITGPAKKPR